VLDKCEEKGGAVVREAEELAAEAAAPAAAGAKQGGRASTAPVPERPPLSLTLAPGAEVNLIVLGEKQADRATGWGAKVTASNEVDGWQVHLAFTLDKGVPRAAVKFSGDEGGEKALDVLVLPTGKGVSGQEKGSPASLLFVLTTPGEPPATVDLLPSAARRAALADGGDAEREREREKVPAGTALLVVRRDGTDSVGVVTVDDRVVLGGPATDSERAAAADGDERVGGRPAADSVVTPTTIPLATFTANAASVDPIVFTDTLSTQAAEIAAFLALGRSLGAYSFPFADDAEFAQFCCTGQPSFALAGGGRCRRVGGPDRVGIVLGAAGGVVFFRVDLATKRGIVWIDETWDPIRDPVLDLEEEGEEEKQKGKEKEKEKGKGGGGRRPLPAAVSAALALTFAAPGCLDLSFGAFGKFTQHFAYFAMYGEWPTQQVRLNILGAASRASGGGGSIITGTTVLSAASASLAGGAALTTGVASIGALIGGGMVASVGLVTLGPVVLVASGSQMLFEDHGRLTEDERVARRLARHASIVAGVVGVASVNAAFVGMSAGGITAGLAAFGPGGVVGGLATLALIPVAAVVAVGGITYLGVRYARKRGAASTAAAAAAAANTPKIPCVLVIGRSGSGKSTLINAVFRRDVAEVGEGRPVTQGFRLTRCRGREEARRESKGEGEGERGAGGEGEEEEEEGGGLNIYDSRGFEEGASEEQEATMLEFVAARAHDAVGATEEVAAVWYVIDGSAGRVDARDVAFATKLLQMVPVVVVLTKVDAATDEDLATIEDDLVAGGVMAAVMRVGNAAVGDSAAELDAALTSLRCEACGSDDLEIVQRRTTWRCDCGAAGAVPPLVVHPSGIDQLRSTTTAIIVGGPVGFVN
jgi:GTP-binding protein EngB required for normal cell division